ncbi:lactococcin 972 family bacteriocin [Lactobacillus corticis]|uniref:Lactococcin 972 family bacteriocin n=1 Tax=Lactobacillus corticis TaxID=2201249 RepID=A0A916QJL6_9LACO|nr:lactococcin 972 family bacteriocin [Lactobacillus corticis]GFZ26500.1 hypothetical protein LCB40_03800 [Lactobacillus corticis]
MKNKKKLILLCLPLVLFASTATTSIALADTVYYKRTPVYWEHGNWGKVRSYSNVQSHRYTHSSTANGVFSGWKKKGVTAKASTWISPTKKATAYWDCKG